MRPNYPLLALTLLSEIESSIRARVGEARTTEQERRAAATAAAGGHGGEKRTPTSAFDPAAGKDVYEPEKLIGQRLSKGVTTFNVKWVGWADKDNTWEPIDSTL